MSNNTFNNRQGFTLVELMMAILIMVVGVFATLTLIDASMKANTTANRLTTKTVLAQQMIEDLISRDKSTFEVPSGAVYNLNITGTETDLVANDKGAGTFHATYSTVWSTTPNLVQINVVVSSVPDDGSPLRTSAYRYLVE